MAKSEWIGRATVNKILGFPTDGRIEVLRMNGQIRTKSVRAGFAGWKIVYNRRDAESAAK
jgi:hypothetical protein